MTARPRGQRRRNRLAAGAWVGTERQRREKAAGVRTMALVALGSCTFTLVGYAFASNTGDSGRVAAQIVAGIGFLGAGVLLRGPSGMQGMTTAATIWMVAAIGMTIGAGHAGAGLGLAVLTRGVLTVVGRWEHSLFGGGRESTVTIMFNPDHGKASIKLEHLLAAPVPVEADDGVAGLVQAPGQAAPLDIAPVGEKADRNGAEAGRHEP